MVHPPHPGEQSDSAGPAAAGEPSLAVQYAPLRRRRWFWSQFIPVVLLAVTGLIVGSDNLPVSANPPPTEQLITLEGTMGSQARFFDDERGRELLLRHHIRVHVTRKGSIDAVTGDLDPFDFIFASGQPAAEFLLDRGEVLGRSEWPRVRCQQSQPGPRADPEFV